MFYFLGAIKLQRDDVVDSFFRFFRRASGTVFPGGISLFLDGNGQNAFLVQECNQLGAGPIETLAEE